MASGSATPSPAVAKHAKQHFETDPRGCKAFDAYLEHLASPEVSAALPVQVDTSHPISHYYISSSHNTYLSGNQLIGKSSTDAYKDVLKRGCRCIEVDIWDGDSPSSSEVDEPEKNDQEVGKLSRLLKRKLARLRSRSNADAQEPDAPAHDDTAMPIPWRNTSGRDEPVVYHGYTATKELPFRKVCEAVREYAFKSSDLPLIVSLEVHCSPPQQEIMVELMQDYWGQYLYRLPADFSDATPLPSLESLRKTILIKVKYSAPEKKRSDRQKDDSDSTSDEDTEEAVKKGKIIPGLSGMGIFTRAFHFNDFDQAESRIPTHVFSLSEGKLLNACKEQPDSLFNHNLHYLMRAYPKGSRLRSTNLDPAPFWRFGVQMVALNFQRMDAAMMLNAAQFEGTGGWMLKAKGYLPTDSSPQSPKPRRMNVDVSVRLYAGQGLGPDHDVPNAYVKCELHVESKLELEENAIPKSGKSKGGEFKQRSSVQHSRDPDFGGESIEFNGVQQVVPELSFLRFKIMDDVTAQKDRLLGWVCYRLDRLPQGLLFVSLRGDDSKHSGGKLLLSIHSQLA